MSELFAVVGTALGLAATVFGWWASREGKRERKEEDRHAAILIEELDTLEAAYKKAHAEGDLDRIAFIHLRLREVNQKIQHHAARRNRRLSDRWRKNI